jgi:hypothetical protein
MEEDAASCVSTPHKEDCYKSFATKNLGDAHRVPMVALLQLPSAFCCFSSLLSFWLPWIYSPFPFFMEFHNDVLLQLVECIESTQNEVKKKMIMIGERDVDLSHMIEVTRE